MSETPTWVLLRGLTRERAHWGPFVDLLKAGLPGARVLALDLPGNGQWSRQRSPTGVAAMVDAARAQLAVMQAKPPYHLLALSLGAMVALDWAHRYPQELAGAVLLNTSLSRFSPFHHRLRPANYAPLLGLLAGRGGVVGREAALLRLTSAKAESHPEVVALWIAIARTRPVSPANAMRQLLAALRYRAPAQPPAVPMLVLVGAGDRFVDPRCSHALAQAWGLPLAEHPSAGHDLTLDDGAWVVEQVAGWVAGRRGRAAPVER
ncbi:alpha/beta fold hydrolase [Ideonella sp.]|uniref:alpha/beta fold hydrolase n=1 Tax=Ideonella sp. TaxID=1929293 RepID=UPI0035B342AB